MTRRSTEGVSFQLLIILACGFLTWPVAGVAQDDILGELIGDPKNQTTQADDSQLGEEEVVEQAATAAPEDGTGSEVAAGAEVNQELATDESAGDAGEADTGQGEVVVPDSEEPGAVEEFLNSGALGLLLNGGVFMWPHVYADVTEDMTCFHEEVFGPAVTVVKADDFEHALHLANASPYGLSSAIYTNDRLEAYRFKTGIKAGMTGINNSTTGAEAHLPFGGVKGSGNGTRESGIWVIEAYSYWHAVNDELSGKLQLAQMDVDEIEMVEAEVDYSSLA